MSSVNTSAANYTRLSGIFDVTLPAEQMVGFIPEVMAVSNSIKFYDGPSVLILSLAAVGTVGTIMRPVPAALVSGGGLRVVSTDATAIVTVFWL